MCPHHVPALIDCTYFTHKYNIPPLLVASLRAIVHFAKNGLVLNTELAESILDLRILCNVGDVDAHYATSPSDTESAIECGWISQLDASDSFEELNEAMDLGG